MLKKNELKKTIDIVDVGNAKNSKHDIRKASAKYTCSILKH